MAWNFLGVIFLSRDIWRDFAQHVRNVLPCYSPALGFTTFFLMYAHKSNVFCFPLAYIFLMPLLPKISRESISKMKNPYHGVANTRVKEGKFFSEF